MVSLYATRVERTGVDIAPALRQRRAMMPSAGEPVGYLAAPVPRVGTPAPVGRGTSTHRQALEAMAASQWATEVGWLPQADRVRVTRAAGGIGAEAGRPGLFGRLAAAATAFRRPRAEGSEPEPLHRLEPQTI
jgi:hypothetical protein